MNQAVAVNVHYAREAHHIALWAEQMTRRFPDAGRLYSDMAKRNRRIKRDFMKRAREVRT